MKTKSFIILGAGLLLLIGTVAAAGVYIMDKGSDKTAPVIFAVKILPSETVPYNSVRPSQAQPPPFPDDGDDNSIETVNDGRRKLLEDVADGTGNKMD